MQICSEAGGKIEFVHREGHIHLACNFIEGGGDIVVPGAYRNQHQSYDHTSKGHMTRIARSFPGAKSRAGHVFRVEASCKFAAGQGGKSKKGLYFIVKSILMLALHAVAGAGAAYPGTY